jgi:DNA helicase-2/ATP-dependent DNA helicase PcrA
MAGLRLISNPQDSVSRDRLDKAFLRGQFREVMTALSAQSSTILSPKECIFLFLETAHYFEYIQKNLSNVRERKENIEELIRFSSRFSALSDFLEQASLAQALDPDPSNKQPPALSLMSIHSSKGLEFDVVFLIGAQEGFLPHMWSLSTPAQLEEERRLLYVAMTRAKQKLWISYHNRPSRFLFDIPHHLTDFSSENGFAASIDDPSDERYITID